MVRRKDDKGRVLKDGESQQRNGRYRYQYTNIYGNRKSVYSWRLIPSDRMPDGKRQSLSLREKEKQIRDKLDSEVIHLGGDMTVLELVEKYICLDVTDDTEILGCTTVYTVLHD